MKGDANFLKRVERKEHFSKSKERKKNRRHKENKTASRFETDGIFNTRHKSGDNFLAMYGSILNLQRRVKLEKAVTMGTRTLAGYAAVAFESVNVFSFFKVVHTAHCRQ